MKHIKKLASILLAMVMVLGLATTAFAANVTVPENSILDGHNFTAYQVFSGREDNSVLSDVQWGSGISSDVFLSALKDDTTYGSLFADCTTAAAVAAVLSDNNTDSALADKVAELAYAHKTGSGTALTTGDNTLADGYYLVVDTTETVGKGSAYNKALLQVVGDIEITVKTSAPSVVKKVKDTNDSEANSTTGWQDSADYDIGDTIPYQLTATMGDLSKYDHYYVEFVDTMTHLTYTGITSVKVGSTTLTGDQYSATWDATNKTLKVVITDVKAYGATTGTEVVVEYTATLDDDAVIGSTGNPNEVYLVYSNNPNYTGDGTNKPGDTGKTPEDKNIVFTYKVVVNKVDKDKQPLEGAGFTLYKKILGTAPEGTNYEAVKEGETDIGYWMPIGDEQVGGTTTQFTWSGLDDGDYKLVETTTPAGYNTIEDVEFTITATHEMESDNPSLTALNVGTLFSGEVSNGTVSADIVNLSGSTLPGTGGIGTTVLYAAGGVLVLLALALLIAKRRTGSGK